MGKGEGWMSVQEADRVVVIRDVVEKRLRQREAAERLGIGVRQVKRLIRRYRERGTVGLASGHRGRRPNNAIDDVVRRQVLELLRERYADFGPTFAREKLVELHGHRLSVETLRAWMIADGLWRAKARRTVRVHQSRPRRECVGDLVQIDGSPHDWFEGRAPACTLIVVVDDATTRLLATRFSPTETTEAHLAAHGQPVDNALGRVVIDRAFRRALPTGCPHSRTSRPQPHSFSNKIFFSKKREGPNRKKGTFLLCVDKKNFALGRREYSIVRFGGV